jgi:hypothetical protein
VRAAAALIALCIASLGCESLVDFEGLSGGDESQLQACPADALFCADFEDGKGAFDDIDQNPDGTNDLIPDPGPRDRADNHVMRLTPPGDLTKVVLNGEQRLHVRWYVKWLRNAGLRAGVYAGDLYTPGTEGHPDGNDWYSALVNARVNVDEVQVAAQYVGMYQDCAGSTCYPDIFPCTADDGDTYCTKPAHRETTQLPQVTDDRWYCIELALDAGTPLPTESGADGTVQYWVDGVSQGPFDGLWIRKTSTLNPNVFWMTLSTASDEPALLVDDLVISTSPIGCPD